MSIRILLADDHTIVLQGLSRFLQEQEGMEVVGQAKDGPSVVELARELAPECRDHGHQHARPERDRGYPADLSGKS